MSSLINQTIRDILMEEQQVCLPGIGTLRLSPQVAVISPIEGKVTPPANRATFNSNLVLDDGRILRSLQEIPILTDEEAEKLLDEFLTNIRDNLDAGRSVVIDGVGKLFKHFDGEIRFTAGGENFSKDSFGLPAIDLKPIARSEKQRRTAADPMLAGSGTIAATTGAQATTVEQPKTSKPQSTWQQIINHPDLKQILWYVAAALATVAIIALGYLVLKAVAAEYGDEPPAREERTPVVVEEPPARQPLPPVDADRVVPEEPPRINDPRRTTTDPAPFDQPAPVTENSAQPSPETEPEVANPPVQSNNPYNTAFIATGLYGSAANVRKNKDRINQAGYEAFSREEGRYTRVGVRVQYTVREDLLETLRAIQEKYDDAYVMEINGEKTRIE